MKTFHTLAFFIAFVVLLPAQYGYTADSEDLKTRIGQTMGMTIKNQGLEFLKAYIVNLQNFYDEIYAKIKIGNEETTRIKSTQKIMQSSLEKLTTMETPKLIELLEHIIQQYFFVKAYGEVKSDEKEKEIIHQLVQKSTDDLHKIETEFLAHLEKKWQELYSTIPAEELAKHKEYNEINRLLSEIKHAEVKGPVLLEFFQTMIRFFDYKDWKFLLDPKQTSKTFMHYFDVKIAGKSS